MTIIHYYFRMTFCYDIMILVNAKANWGIQEPHFCGIGHRVIYWGVLTRKLLKERKFQFVYFLFSSRYHTFCKEPKLFQTAVFYVQFLTKIYFRNGIHISQWLLLKISVQKIFDINLNVSCKRVKSLKKVKEHLLCQF